MRTAIDFLPADYVSLHVRRMQTRWRQLALLVLTALVGLGVLRESQCRRQDDQLRQAIETRVASLTEKSLNANAIRARLESAERQADALARLELSVRPSRLLATVTNALPPGTRLTSFRFELASPTPAIESTEGTISVSGISNTDSLIAQLLERLELTGQFPEVVLKRIEGGDDSRRRFWIRLRVAPLGDHPATLDGLAVRFIGEDVEIPELPDPLRRTP